MSNERTFHSHNGARQSNQKRYDHGQNNRFKPAYNPKIESESNGGNRSKNRFWGDRQKKRMHIKDNEATSFSTKKVRSAFREKEEYKGKYQERSRVYSKKKQLEYKKNLSDFNAPIRLNKFIANSGVCSRREADEFIAAGVVTVNGDVVTELGKKIIPSKDKVLFHDQLLCSEKKIYVLLNKPKDCVTTTEDPHARLTVMDIIKNACTERIYPVGRLDRNTTGVLLLTNDGELATVLTHPKFNKKKVYQVTLDKPILQGDIDKLLEGVVLEDGEICADDIAYLSENHRLLGVEIHSGRNRIIRRMFDHLGYTVKQLDRSVFAGLTKKNLPRGKWRFLSEKEVAILKMGAYE